MRQSRIIVLLLLLLCAGGGVAWLIASGSAGDAANGAPLSELSPVLDNSAPLNAEQQPHDNTAPELRDKPDRIAPRRPERKPEPPPSTEPGPGEWVIKGRFRFAEGLPLDTVTFFHGEWFYPWIIFRNESGESPEVRDISPTVAQDGSFRELCSESLLPFELRDGKVPVGRWQVSCMLEMEAPTLFDVGEDVSIEQLRGLVTPTITGRVIDFGDITLEHADLFGDQWLITGRIVHVTGRALSNCSGLRLVLLQDSETIAESYFSTDSDGRFVDLLWDEESIAGDPAGWTARLYNDEAGFYGLSQAGRAPRLEVELPRPKVKGRVADFGEIRVAGALVDVEAEVEGQTPELLPDGRLLRSNWVDYPGSSGTLDMWDGFFSANALIYPSPARTTLWLHDGRYEYNAEFWVEGFYYPRQSGIVTPRDGEVVVLKLKFPRYRMIPLEFEVPEGATVGSASVDWSALRGEHVEHGGMSSGSPPLEVPVFPGMVTEFRVEADGFAPAIATATDKDEKMVIRLTPAPAGIATLRVTVPEVPAEVSPHVLGANLTVSNIENGERAFSMGCRPGEVQVPIPAAGRYRVTLNGGGAYGYPDVLSGPIDVSIQEGEEAVVVLPPIGPPPWPAYISGYQCNVRCAGRAIALEADVFVGAGDRVMRAEMRTGERFGLAAPPLALPDGDSRIPLELVTPTEAGEHATVSLDMEARIEVKVSRQGQPVKDFSATVDGKNAAGSRVYMVGDEHGGSVLLWAQPGTATLLVDVEGREFTRTVEIRRGELAQAEFQLDLVRVQFDLGLEEEPDSYGGVSAPWTVFRVYENREEECCYLWVNEEVLFDPGRYRAVPGYGDPALAVEFDISDGKDRVVKLPQLPERRLFTLLLKFDTTFFGDQLFEADFGVYQAAMLTRPDSSGYGNYIQTRSVAEGIELIDLPGDTDLVITGSTWIEEGGSTNTWLMKPLRIRVTADQQVASCSWTRSVPMAEEWWGLSAWNVSALQGLYIRVGDTQTLFPGRQELVFTDGAGKEVAREWIDVPADAESFSIPATLRATLEARELLAPIHPEEMPPDEE